MTALKTCKTRQKKKPSKMQHTKNSCAPELPPATYKNTNLRGKCKSGTWDESRRCVSVLL